MRIDEESALTRVARHCPPEDDLGLKLGKARVFSDITSRHFADLGRRSGFGAAESISRAETAAENILDHWSVLREYLTKQSLLELAKRLRTLPLVNARLEIDAGPTMPAARAW